MKNIFAVFCFLSFLAVSLSAQDYKVAEPYGTTKTSGKLGAKAPQKYTYLYDTTLIQAIKAKDEHRVKMLMYAHINPNEKNDQGFTPLYFGAQYLTPKTFTMLLDNGARVNLKSTYNLTPLMAAAAAGRTDIIKILLEYGADPNLLDDKELTALDHALNNHQIDAALMLNPVTTIKKPTMNILELSEDNSYTPASEEQAAQEPKEEAAVTAEETLINLDQQEPATEQKEEPATSLEEEAFAPVISPAAQEPVYNPTIAEIDAKIEKTQMALDRLRALREQLLLNEAQTMSNTAISTKTTSVKTTKTKSSSSKATSAKKGNKSQKNK